METLATLSLDELNPGQINALVALGIAAGTLYCFLGYRTIKFVIALTGFLLAGGVAAAAVGFLTEGHLISMAAAGLIGGICGAMALHFLYKTGIFILGMLGAALVAQETFAARPEAWMPLLVIAIGIGGGLIALLLERPVVMLATSAIGAWMLVAGIVFFLMNAEASAETSDPIQLDDYHLYIAAAWAGLALIGAITQWSTRAKKSST